MSNRVYNILFHTHTVSGIVISVALFVIFFAGSFSFFRDEIIGWERNEPVMEGMDLKDIDVDRMLDSISEQKELYGRDVSFTKFFNERRLGVNITASQDSKAGDKAQIREFFYMDAENLNSYTYGSNYSIGEFLYRLHFFAQLNLWGTSGYLLSGFVAFFFLFAIITGVFVHWKKIVSNFYVFRPMASLKNLWTDAHTALGILGLPYQFVYAVTGTCLIIGTSVMSPAVVTFMYDGDTNELYDDFGFNPLRFDMRGEKLAEIPSVNAFVAKAGQKWKGFEVKSVKIYNYGDKNMRIGIDGYTSHNLKFAGRGDILYDLDGAELQVTDPHSETSYQDAAMAVITQLHYGDYGGVPLRIVYFILGIASCFVIISGVMIWLVARDKKHVPEKQRKFNAWVVWIYLAVCLSLFPVTAFTFLMVKVFLTEFTPERLNHIYQIFFYSWLILSVFFTLKRDNYFTNKYTLICGAVLGFMVPLANGWTSGNWLWVSLSAGHYQVFFIDVFWLSLSVVALIIASNLKRTVKKHMQVSSYKKKEKASSLDNKAVLAD